MSGTAAEDGRVYQEDLNDDERTIAKRLYDWVDANPAAHWKPLEKVPGVEQCSELSDMARTHLPKVGLSCPR